MSKFPEWVTSHKTKGTEVRFINKRYYLYSITSKWDPIKKRAVKKTLALLGNITEQGFRPSQKNELKNKKTFEPKSIVQKEFGFSIFIHTYFKDIIAHLQSSLPDDWQTILVLSYCRFLYQSPFKKMEFRFEHSFLSELYPELNLNKANLSGFIRQLGDKRESMKKYFSMFWTKEMKQNILFDASSMASMSHNMENFPKQGYNSRGNFDPQLNLMLIYSTTLRMPMYYRVLPGNVREVSAFKLCLKDFSADANITIITDKGFYSHKNLEEMKDLNINFVMPLRRNDTLVKYDKIKNGIDKSKLDGHFIFENRVIWYYQIKSSRGEIFVYIDDYLKANEERDYILRAEKKEEKDMNKFFDKNFQLGTIAILTTAIDPSAKDIYEIYKSRNEVELVFDAFKNVLNADVSYMQSDIALEAWMFINYIATQMYYIIYNKLKDKNLLSKYSPAEVGEILSEIRKIKINDQWYLAEVTSKSKKLLEKLDYADILSK